MVFRQRTDAGLPSLSPNAKNIRPKNSMTSCTPSSSAYRRPNSGNTPYNMSSLAPPIAPMQQLTPSNRSYSTGSSLPRMRLTATPSPRNMSFNFSPKHQKSNKGRNQLLIILLSVLSFSIVVIFKRYNFASDQLTNIKSQLDLMKSERDEYESNFQYARKIANELSNAAQLLQSQSKELESDKELMLKSIDRLKARIQLDSKREVIEQFGPGPHRVEFTLNLPSPQNKFIVEMAPIDLMPHSTHVFLEAVHHKVWNGKSFWLNAYHLLQATATPTQGSGRRIQEEWNRNLDRHEAKKTLSVTFQEYSHEFPHEAYTLGFAGSPSGPDFYISKKDNSESHGPNKQEHHALPGDADPCFAKVISGFDTLGKMSALEVKNDHSSELVKPVIILQAVIL